MYNIFKSIDILVEITLFFGFLDGLFFQFIHELFVSLGLSLDIGPVNLLNLNNLLLRFL